MKSQNQVLELMVAQSMIDSLLKEEEEISVPENEVLKNFNTIKSQTGKFAFKLSQSGSSVKKLKSSLKRDLRQDQFLRAQMVSKGRVSDSEINALYFKQTGKPLFDVFEYEVSMVSFPGGKEGLELAKAFSFEKRGKYRTRKFKTGGDPF